MGALAPVRLWLAKKLLAWGTSRTVVRGIPVVVYNTRPDVDTAHALARLDAALGLIERHVPHYFRRLRRDFASIRIQRYACRGAYFSDDHSCLVELTLVVNRSFSEAQVAATILHEAMHARLHRAGLTLGAQGRARQERFCRRAEVEFGEVVPGGQAIVERAVASLEGSDEDVAPVIDRALARKRIAEADLDAAAMPRWLKRVIARRRGLTPPA